MSNSEIRIGVAGHVGIGHVHGYAGFIQDDSGGFVTVGGILRELLRADTRVELAEADVDANCIRIVTVDGGVGTASPRRGITPSEAGLIGGLVGQDALFCQRAVINALGRMYGQGVLETPVALQAALANAVVDTFSKKAQAKFAVVQESIRGNRGLIGGLAVAADGVGVSYLMSVNYTAGGLGPVEDLEGNVALGSKGDVMKALGMLRCPTVVVEGKAYLPPISDGLDQNTFLVRAQADIDNGIVARALFDAAKELGYPVVFRDDLLPRVEGSMARQTVDFADRISDCAHRLRIAELASDKASIVAEMAELISQDAGAITCISNRLHDVVRGVGMIPGTSAALSMLVTKGYYEHWKIPLFERADAERAQHIVGLAIEKIAVSYDAACADLEQHYESLAPLAQAGSPHPPVGNQPRVTREVQSGEGGTG
jgi:hypothetical protein